MLPATLKFVLIFALLCAVLRNCFALPSAERDLIIALQDVTPCPAKINVGWTMSNVTLQKDVVTMQTSISGNLVQIEPYRERFHVQLEISRCVSEDESSCYKFLVLHDSNFCRDLHNPRKMWAPMMKHVDLPPNVSCPVPAASYTMTKVPITQTLMDREVYMPGIWRVLISIKDGNRVLGCIQALCEIKFRRRSRKRLP